MFFLFPILAHSISLCLIGPNPPILYSLIQTAVYNWQLYAPISVQDCPLNTEGLNTINLNVRNPQHPGLTRFRSDGTTHIEIDSHSIGFLGNIYNVMLHELGHTLGLKHPQPPNDSIMSYQLQYNVLTNEYYPDPYHVIHPYTIPAFQSNSSLNAELGLSFG